MSETSELFDVFWLAYPKKVAKGEAQKAWRQITPDQAAVKEMLAALSWQREQAAWRRDSGKYIPNPATWLRGHRWQDEPFEPVRKDAFSMHRYPTMAEWVCTHTPKCGARSTCLRLTALGR